MQKRIILATITPGEPDIQLALYNLKVYLSKKSQKAECFNIEIQTYSPLESINDISNKLLNSAADFIGFSCYEWNIIKIIAISRDLKKYREEMQIILGGPEVSPRAREILKSETSIDVIVIGEGEQTFLELMESYLENRHRLDEIKGIAFRKNGRICVTGKREEINNLDEIPSSYLAGVIPDELIQESGYLPMETHRGCPYQCSYCYYGKEFSRVRYFSLSRVESELKYLLALKPAGIYLMDPTFNLNRTRAAEVLKLYVKYNICSRLHVELKAELLNRITIELLSKAKADFVEIGIQSMNKRTLAAINREFDPQAFERSIQRLNAKKIPYEIQLIDSLPYETYQSLTEAMDWLLHLKPYSIKIMRLSVLPGTILRAKAKEFGIRFQRTPPYHSICSATFTGKDIERTAKLRLALGLLYNLGLLRRTIFQINKQSGFSFLMIFECWLTWMRENHPQRLSIFTEKDKKFELVRNRSLFLKYALKGLAEIMPEFIETLMGRDQVKMNHRLKQSLNSDLAQIISKLDIRKEIKTCTN